MDIIEKLNAIAEHYGLPTQMTKTVEEMTELTDAMSEWMEITSDGEDNHAEWEHILEETADVLVMLCQIIHLTGQQPYMVRRRMDEKSDRQLCRIREEKQNDREK